MFIKSELTLRSDYSTCEEVMFCVEVMVWCCIKREGKTDDQGDIVEIDESKFRKR